MMNRQINRTMNVIFDALLKKMQIKPFHEISIVEITEQADVARLSFYRHFNTKEDIIIFKIKEIVGRFVRKMNTSTISASKDILDMLLGMVDNYRSIFNVIINNNLYGLIVQSFSPEIKMITKRLFGLLDSDTYVLTFYEGAFVNLIIEWVRSGEGVSKEEYSNILDRLINKQKLLFNYN